jgi:hypothetical protein
MGMAVILNLVVWGVLVLALTGMFIYRRSVDGHGDHTVHLHDDPLDARIISSQVAIGKRLDGMDKAIRYMVIAVVVYGVVVAGLACYQAWLSSYNPIG